MRFLWFGKKRAPAAVNQPESTPPPQDVYSVVGYVCDTDPLAGAKNTQLSAELILSMSLTVLAQSSSPADIAAQEFFQVHGAHSLPISDYAFSADRGISAHVTNNGDQKTILIGTPEVIARVSAPFSPKIAAAALANTDGFVVAIDGIAYVSFAIAKEIL